MAGENLKVKELTERAARFVKESSEADLVSANLRETFRDEGIVARVFDAKVTHLKRQDKAKPSGEVGLWVVVAEYFGGRIDGEVKQSLYLKTAYATPQDAYDAHKRQN